jgi:hypothetical protein
MLVMVKISFFSIDKFRNLEFEMVNVTGIVQFSQYQFIITLKTDKIRLFVRLEIRIKIRILLGIFQIMGFICRINLSIVFYDTQ